MQTFISSTKCHHFKKPDITIFPATFERPHAIFPSLCGTLITEGSPSPSIGPAGAQVHVLLSQLIYIQPIALSSCNATTRPYSYLVHTSVPLSTNFFGSGTPQHPPRFACNVYQQCSVSFPRSSLLQPMQTFCSNLSMFPSITAPLFFALDFLQLHPGNHSLSTPPQSTYHIPIQPIQPYDKLFSKAFKAIWNHFLVKNKLMRPWRRTRTVVCLISYKFFFSTIFITILFLNFFLFLSNFLPFRSFFQLCITIYLHFFPRSSDLQSIPQLLAMETHHDFYSCHLITTNPITISLNTL